MTELELKTRLDSFENAVTQLEKRLESNKSKITSLVLDSGTFKLHRQNMKKMELDVKTAVDLVTRKTKEMENKLRDVDENNLDKKMEEQKQRLEIHLKKYEAMTKELRERFGTLGGI